jgi:hypothetical protein
MLIDSANRWLKECIQLSIRIECSCAENSINAVKDDSSVNFRFYSINSWIFRSSMRLWRISKCQSVGLSICHLVIILLIENWIKTTWVDLRRLITAKPSLPWTLWSPKCDNIWLEFLYSSTTQDAHGEQVCVNQGAHGLKTFHSKLSIRFYLGDFTWTSFFFCFVLLRLCLQMFANKQNSLK